MKPVTTVVVVRSRRRKAMVIPRYLIIPSYYLCVMPRGRALSLCLVASRFSVNLPASNGHTIKLGNGDTSNLVGGGRLNFWAG